MTPAARNLLSAIPGDLAVRPELVDVLARAGGVRIERIVSHGHASPPDFWYDQPEDEWVLVVSGRARLRFAPDAVLELVPGDHVFIPAQQRHRVDWTDPACDTVWIAVFLPPSP